jgi:exodeoxyribonuclease VII large subunit
MNARQEHGGMAAEQKVYSLSAVTRAIERALAEPASRTFWVQAEVASPRMVGGHLYATLVELRDGTTVAKMHCTVWESTLRQIRAAFTAAGLTFELSQGVKACLLCRISFHAVYGLSLTILDADPRFVLGELELRKRRLIEQLVKEGLDTKNKQRVLLALPLRLGVVTSREGDAFNDILRPLRTSGFGFVILLADAFMQGENAERSILRAIAALEAQRVDMIVIARGGGNRTDLAWLDNEAIARRIAACGLPVWTGIGHTNDTGVLDAVAHTTCGTPTAVGEAIAARFEAAANIVERARSLLSREWQHRIAVELRELRDNVIGLRQGTRKLAGQARTSLLERSERVGIVVERRLSGTRQGSQLAAQRLRMHAARRVQTLSTPLTEWARRARTAAQRQRAASAARLAMGRSRLDPARLKGIIASGKSVAFRYAMALSKSASIRLASERALSARRGETLRRGAWLARFQSRAHRLTETQRTLMAHDPQKVLERGYAIVTAGDGRIIPSARILAPGDEVLLTFHDGDAAAHVHSVNPSEEPRP